jgi:hypothetical protein
MTPGKLALLLALATALAMAVICQSNARLRVGYQLQELRAEIGEQQAERSMYGTQLSKLRNPQRIMRLVAQLGLDLQEGRIAVAEADEGLVEAPPGRLASAAEGVPNTVVDAGGRTDLAVGLPVAAATDL